MTTPHNGFHDLGIDPGILNVIDGLKFTVPTPIQQKAIPIAVMGQDVIGVAQTGTGKTLSFGIPLVQRLLAQPGKKALVLVPTRELALQVNETLLKLAAPFKLRTVALIGGESIHTQITWLRYNPAILIATPGRLNDHLGSRNIRLDDVRILVLDEADRMLDMGFFPQIERVLKTVPRERQTMLFSATMPAGIVNLASNYMRLPVRTEIAPSGTAAELVSQEMYIVAPDSKGPLLGELLKQFQGTVLLFVRTRRSATRVTHLLKTLGHAAAEIHADRSLSQRKAALKGFKSGEYRILVATDIAARGIDVSGIEVVINYDLPDDPENYVHRIGRTGRAGLKGNAVTLATPDQGGDVRRIERILRGSIPRKVHHAVRGEDFDGSSPPPRRGGGGGGGGGGRGQRGRPSGRPSGPPRQPNRPPRGGLGAQRQERRWR